MSRDTDWQFVGAGADGQAFFIDSLDVWKHKWKDTEERAHVKDPRYQQDFTFHVWEIRTGDLVVTFAAGEFSNCMWGSMSGRESPNPAQNRTTAGAPVPVSDVSVRPCRLVWRSAT